MNKVNVAIKANVQMFRIGMMDDKDWWGGLEFGNSASVHTYKRFSGVNKTVLCIGYAIPNI